MKDFKAELTIEKAREIVRCKSIEATDEDFNKYRNVDLYPARAFIQAWEQQEGKIKRLVKKADREARRETLRIVLKCLIDNNYVIPVDDLSFLFNENIEELMPRHDGGIE